MAGIPRRDLVHGRAAALLRVSSVGRLRWIDEGALIFGLVDGRTARLPAILQWWLDSHATQGVRADSLFRPVEQGLVVDAPLDVATSCPAKRTPGMGESPAIGPPPAWRASRWIQDTRLVYGAVNGVTGNLASLLEWWDARH